MLGLSTRLARPSSRSLLTYVTEGLKLFPMHDEHSEELQFVGTDSMSFDGGDYVDTGTTLATALGDNYSGSFTVSMWFKTDVTSGNDGMFYMGSFSDANGELEIAMSSNLIKFKLNAGVWERNYSFTDTSSWHHLACIYDTSGASASLIYLDGVSVSTATSGSFPADADLDFDGLKTIIGSYYGSAYGFDGSLKNVAFWNRALTATEVQNVMYKTYAGVSGRLLTGMVSWWALEESVVALVTKVADSHGSNTGTITGATISASGSGSKYGGTTPIIPRSIDNSDEVQADAIGAGSALFVKSATDYIDTSATFQTTLDGAFTVSAWIKLNDGQPSVAESIVGSSSTGDEDKFRVRVDTDGKIRLVYKSNAAGSSMDDASTSAVFANGATDWTHIAATFTESGGTVTGGLYVNGVSEAGSFSGTAAMADFVTSNNLYIGALNEASGISEYFDGNICQVGIWSAVLTQAQIQSIMEKTFEELTASEKTNLVSYWALDEGLKSLSFDGTNDSITTGADDTLADATYSWWMKASDTTSNRQTAVFGHGGADIGTFHIQFDSSRPILYMDGGYYRYFTDTPAQDDGVWHHWMVFIDADDITGCTLYVDGVAISVSGTSASGSANTYTQGLTIGCRDNDSGGTEFLGEMAQFAVWSGDKTSNAVAMTNEAIDADWTDNYSDDMTGYWKMDNGSTVTDLSGQGNNGTVVNATLVDGAVLDKTSNNNDGAMN